MTKPMFYQKVDKRNRQEMLEFLNNHFRYYTMNPWNRTTSWAHNMKIHTVIPGEYQDKVFDLINTDDYFFEIESIIRNWEEDNEYKLQAGFNGRSGGYLVMYEGYITYKRIFTFERTQGGRDYADNYGWKSLEEAKKQGLYNKEIPQIHTHPGRSVDEEDFEDLELHELKLITERVQKFDKLCDEIVEATIQMAKTCKVTTETVYISKEVKKVECI